MGGISENLAQTGKWFDNRINGIRDQINYGKELADYGIIWKEVSNTARKFMHTNLGILEGIPQEDLEYGWMTRNASILSSLLRWQEQKATVSDLRATLNQVRGEIAWRRYHNEGATPQLRAVTFARMLASYTFFDPGDRDNSRTTLPNLAGRMVVLTNLIQTSKDNTPDFFSILRPCVNVLSSLESRLCRSQVSYSPLGAGRVLRTSGKRAEIAGYSAVDRVPLLEEINLSPDSFSARVVVVESQEERDRLNRLSIPTIHAVDKKNYLALINRIKDFKKHNNGDVRNGDARGDKYIVDAIDVAIASVAESAGDERIVVILKKMLIRGNLGDLPEGALKEFLVSVYSLLGFDGAKVNPSRAEAYLRHPETLKLLLLFVDTYDEIEGGFMYQGKLLEHGIGEVAQHKVPRVAEKPKLEGRSNGAKPPSSKPDFTEEATTYYF